MCVARCEDFGYNYVSNYETGKCEYCGETCTLCSPKLGCLSDYMLDRGYKSVWDEGSEAASSYPSGEFPFSPAMPATTFNTTTACSDSRCDKCQEWDGEYDPAEGSKRCDSCFQYVHMYEPFRQQVLEQGGLGCVLCDSSNVEHCNMCDPDDENTCLSCVQDYYLNKATASCELCSADLAQEAGCSRCDADECLECLPGFYMEVDAATGFSKCSAC